jgi:hypothetical protein
MSGIHFPAVVRKLGINPCVDVPGPVVARLLRAARKTSGPIPVNRREYLLYLNSLKTLESLARNVKKVIRLLVEHRRPDSQS